MHIFYIFQRRRKVLKMNISTQKQPPEVFYKKRCSSKFRRIHRKTPVPENFFNKVAGLRLCNFTKKESLAQVFSREFCEISKKTFFTEHLRTTATDYDKKIVRIVYNNYLLKSLERFVSKTEK